MTRAWKRPKQKNRVAPRDCVDAARRDLNLAFQAATAEQALYGIRGALDWLRRAVEQMADD